MNMKIITLIMIVLVRQQTDSKNFTFINNVNHSRTTHLIWLYIKNSKSIEKYTILLQTEKPRAENRRMCIFPTNALKQSDTDHNEISTQNIFSFEPSIRKVFLRVKAPKATFNMHSQKSNPNVLNEARGPQAGESIRK